MELVEGKTLRELIAGGSLPIKKLLQIGTQMAEGLARAHEAGIVHRDLKPENVMVTKDGLVKILDFGLAKLTDAGPGSGRETHLPTQTATTPGIVMGTVGYMSPEQAGGQLIDFRSDQFSFGSILYEMATGKRAFQKKTAIDTLSAILNEDPEPVGAVNPQVPAPLAGSSNAAWPRTPRSATRRLRISPGSSARCGIIFRRHRWPRRAPRAGRAGPGDARRRRSGSLPPSRSLFSWAAEPPRVSPCQIPFSA